jgi:hypothetical protein
MAFMKSRVISLGVLLAGSLLSASAAAEQLADNGTFALGVDRMFGYVSYNASYDSTTTTGVKTSHEATVSNFSLLGRAGNLGVGNVGIAQIPRISFDAFVGPGVSLGGSIMYDYYSIGSKNAGQEDPDKPSVGVWLISPRVGFAKMFTPQIGIWPRAGITYIHASVDSPYTDTTTGVTTANTDSVGELYYTMDVNLIIAPVAHLGFTVGPTLDYLLSDSESHTPADTTPNSNYKAHALGVQAGIFAWF